MLISYKNRRTEVFEVLSLHKLYCITDMDSDVLYNPTKLRLHCEQDIAKYILTHHPVIIYELDVWDMVGYQLID